jgi:hypothetical protein
MKSSGSGTVVDLHVVIAEPSLFCLKLGQAIQSSTQSCNISVREASKTLAADTLVYHLNCPDQQAEVLAVFIKFGVN